ncbi:MAG: DEAD/DEAH box helicase [Proteobacteria bacterium]|nr:DEAD/DEAH box helicase [Pseudomonadota bacterium]
MKTRDVREYLEALKRYDVLSPFMVDHREIPGKEGCTAEPSPPFPDFLKKLLSDLGITALYSHQIAAIDRIRKGLHTVIATPTASGKTLIYNLSMIEHIAENPKARALYLFPLKALAQDQLKSLNTLTRALDRPGFLSAEIYDGDTTPYRRKKIRNTPPNVLLSNPEMLHLSILPYHSRWSEFIENLKYVVVDEVHTLRGVMGSHMAWVFRRLLRICEVYGAKPVFIFCSATIGNPGRLASGLTGLPVASIKNCGAPMSGKHFLMLNTPDGAAQASIALLHAALSRNLRTIIYTQSRKMTELIALWAARKAGKYSSRISAYRAGFLPEERREIETRLSSGELLAVVTTSALEMGIDIGSLDLCILVGYPGTVMATWQRAGRVGRAGRESAVILIGHEDALDQYIMHNPDEFFHMAPEMAVINPDNPVIMKRHLVCAAAELPLKEDEPLVQEKHTACAVKELEMTGGLLRSEDGELFFSPGKYPHREVDLRGTGDSVDIVDQDSGEIIGNMDKRRAFHEAYPGAVYIHRGTHYLVRELDLAKNTAYALKEPVHYFTRARSSKETDIIEILDEKQIWSTRMVLCRLKVTETVTGYEKRLIRGQRILGVYPLALPPLVMETEGIFIEIPEIIRKHCETGQRHFMGGIHAMEHAAIGILPLLVMTDRNDLGGISIPHHYQIGSGAVFVYDGYPGGVGLSRRAFECGEALVERTLSVIETCSCENGCPACVHSPKCGSGNRPIDKYAAREILYLLKTGTVAPAKKSPLLQIKNGNLEIKAPYIVKPDLHFGVLDLETRRSAEEVGGWGNASRMGISCVVVYDSKSDRYEEYMGDEMPRLVAHVKALDLLVGFNIIGFDYAVLNGNTAFNFHNLPTLDMLAEIHKRLGYRLSLDHLGEQTLGTRKSADGLMALKWWKEGKINEIVAYCRQDVRVTRDLYLFGRENRYLLFKNKGGTKVRVPVSW